MKYEKKRSSFERLHYLLHKWDEERTFNTHSPLPDREAELSARKFELVCKQLVDKLNQNLDRWLGGSNGNKD